MIQLQNLTPEIYYKQSRDFQFIGRLYDLVLNSAKTNVDLVRNIFDNKQLAENLALTMGFNLRKNYNNKQLFTIAEIFPLLLKQKGSIAAITTLVKAILNAEGILPWQDVEEHFVEVRDYKILIYVPEQLQDTTLLNDVLDYIIPAGMTVEIYKTALLHSKIESAFNASENSTTTYGPSDFINNDHAVINTVEELIENIGIGVENKKGISPNENIWKKE